MLIRLIGPVTVSAGEHTTRISAPKRACVLAVLAAEPGAPVTQPDLIDRVWGNAPPETVTGVLYSYIARLRVELRPVGATIERAGGHGYVLKADPDAIDLHRLRALADRAASGGDIELWRRACALAQGEPLAGIGGRWAEEFRASFGRERSGLLAARYDAELAAGRHAAVIGELSALAGEDPFAEPLVGHLMLALYRSGRPSEALNWFEATRVRLRDDLGTDPSPQLRDLHRRILNQDPGLSIRAGSVPAADAPAQLPADVATFTGREPDLAALSAAAKRGGTVLVTGQAGAGKTALSVHWGHANRAMFPDGQLYINLRGFDRGETVAPRDALGRLLHALGVADVPADVDQAAELFRTLTSGKRMLVVLDNAGTAAQVRPLLPGPDCFTVVTSRDRLPGLVAVDDAAVVALTVLTREDAALLLRRILGEVDDADADTLAGLCGDLPLALRIAAANVASGIGGEIASYTKDLASRDRLALLAVDGDPDATVTAALDQSFAALDAESRGLFCRIGVIPGEDASGELIAAVSGLAPEAAARHLRRLVSAHLVDEYRPGRYRTHDLVGLYAVAKADSELSKTGVEAVVDAFIDWHYERSLDPAVTEESNIFRACETLREHPRAWRLVRRLMDAINGGRFLDRVEEMITMGLRHAMAGGDPLAVFQMENLRASLLRAQRDTAASIALGRRVIELAPSLGKRETMVAIGNQGLRFLQASDLREAARLLGEATRIAAEIGNPFNLIGFGSTLIQVLVRLGDRDAAERCLESMESVDESAVPEGQRPKLLKARAEVAMARGDTDAAMDTLTELLAVAGSTTPPFSSNWCLTLGNLLREAGRADLSREVFEANIAYLRSHPSTTHEPAMLQAHALTMNALGEHTRAIELVTEAEGKWGRKPSHAPPEADLILAQALNGLGDHERALLHARDAADAYGAMPWLDKHAEALKAMEEAETELRRARSRLRPLSGP